MLLYCNVCVHSSTEERPLAEYLELKQSINQSIKGAISSRWLVLRIGGADFLRCWVTDSIWLERAELLITT